MFARLRDRRIAQLAVAVVLAGVGPADVMAVADAQRPSAPAQDRPAAEKPRELSRRERKDRIARLPEHHREFLKIVEVIISAEEINIFLLMESDAQRDRFIGDFWRRRDPDPRTAVNEYKEDFLARREEALQKFRYLGSDQARVYLLRGRPGEVLRDPSCSYLRPIEIWRYSTRDFRAMLVFYEQGGSYRLWVLAGGNLLAALEELIPPFSIAKVEQIFFDHPIQVGQLTVMKPALLKQCRIYEPLMEAIEQAKLDRASLFQRVYQPPQVDEQDARAILRTTVVANPDAPKIAFEKSVRYGPKRGERTAVGIQLLLDAANLRKKEIGGRSFYNLDLAGEILKDDKIFESFHYRFDFPAEGSPLPIAVERHLYFGQYTAKLKVLDTNSGAEAVVEIPLDVPRVDVAETKPPEQTGTDESESGALLRILPVAEGEIVVGFRRIETIANSEAIRAVEFALDGKRVMVKRSAPFAMDLDFGPVPRRHVIRVTGVDEKGRPVDADEIAVNEGADPFRLQVVIPRTGARVSGPTRVELDLRVPEGRTLRHVEIFLNEDRVATLYAPPFTQTIHVPAGTVGYIRAVATANEPDLAPVDHLVFINTSEFSERVEVHLIELPVTVLRDGKPVRDLPQPAFRVLDRGKPVRIERFEQVQDLPLSIGIAIDSSSSMRGKLLAAQQAAGEFFRAVLRPSDRAFLIAFDRQPTLVRNWTADQAALTNALSTLRAEELTAMYDAVVQALYRFQGVQGQRALIVLGDGRDTASKFSFDQAIEYAKRSGVPIYTIGIGLGAGDVDPRQKLTRFATETGGSAFFIDDVSGLRAIYGQIENELRSQYLLAFYPPAEAKAGGDWREVRVEVDGARVKTIRGYYP